MRRARHRSKGFTTATEVSEALDPYRHPLRDEHDLDPLLKRCSECRLVLLGEASHGTSEFYTWRIKISRRLIEEQGFGFIAVEGDWPDCYRINRFVKGQPDSQECARGVLMQFHRWPTWMWANQEMIALVEWMRSHNDRVPAERRAGFYGLDVYSLWESLGSVLSYLKRIDGPAAAADAARKAFECFEPYDEDAQRYARATRWLPSSCEDEVVKMLQAIRKGSKQYASDGRDAYFDAEQNALTVKNAEHYYRTMVRGDNESWNVRDRHMIETLDRLLDFHGPQSKGIVWAHNTHIGDARATDMAAADMVNLGQLAREKYGEEQCVLTGFSTDHGNVIAADEWGAPWERVAVPQARRNSWDAMLTNAGKGDQMLIFDQQARRAALLEAHGQRAIGVVYHPHYERLSNYVPTVLPLRYDALLHIYQTDAVTPLPVEVEFAELPETYPSAV